jgi:LPS sulfotransferase NodH
MMTSWDQFGADYDFPAFTGTARSYLIASTPRCGSHYLGHLLRGTGLLGSPLEYFSRGRMADWQARLGTTAHRDLFKRLLRRRTSPSGWFGVKAHWPQFEPIAADAELFDFFHLQLFVQLTRSDRVAQAVSLVIAQQTSAWISFQPPTRQPIYDAAAIAAALAGIDHQLDCWQRFFATRGIEPLLLSYDDLVADPAVSVRRVLACCGLPAADLPIHATLLPQRQASPLNQAWAERFRAEQLAPTA